MTDSHAFLALTGGIALCIAASWAMGMDVGVWVKAANILWGG